MDKSFRAVVAAMVSFFVVTAVLAAVLIICRNNTRRRDRNRNRNRNRRQRRSICTNNHLHAHLDESISFDLSLQQQISMDKIVFATRNFSAELIIGDGSFGLVYKAQLPDGPIVAIKKLDPDAFQGFREFRAEIETLGKLRHPNLVRILGYCVSKADRILIYEFIERGNLDFWLHDDAADHRLPWATRMRIVLGVAEALAYLHDLDKPIIHRDIKASNVLLDSNYDARISDFGLARTIDSSQSHVYTQVAGTMGYMPPEYKDGYPHATVKGDIYSFGILMLEIATGRRPNLPVLYQHANGEEGIDNAEMGIVQWARRMIDRLRHMEMLDPCFSTHILPAEPQVSEYLRIACLCARELPKDRPAMKQVVHFLLAMQLIHQPSIEYNPLNSS